MTKTTLPAATRDRNRRFRAALGWDDSNVAQFAAKLGVSRQAVDRVLKGAPSARLIAEIERYTATVERRRARVVANERDIA